MTKGKKILLTILTSLLVVMLCILAGEAVLRFVPIPGVNFAAIKYDEVFGAGYYPNSVVTYRSDRNDYVERFVNRWGYLDVDHELEGEGGVFRIGFFGDSYTESVQVPIDSTFFRRIEGLTSDRSVECLAFGFSGRGTVHSYLVAMQEMVRFDLDMVVYVFCENDVGDQIEEIKREPNFPNAKIENGKLIVDTSFRVHSAFRTAWPYRVYQFMQSKSLFLQTLKRRLELLSRFGVQVTNVQENNEDMTTPIRAIPNQNDAPSTWSAPWRIYAAKVGSAMIAKWRRVVRNSGREFAIIHIPRESEWRKNSEQQDSWKYWLEGVCIANDIDLLDPKNRFEAADSLNQELYYDHLTAAGHHALSLTFVEWFNAKQSTYERR